MAPKIFLTGATGYIGGDALYALNAAHPEYEITALVRTSDKGALVASQYPKVRLVYGDLDNSALLEEESAKADIVLHTADASDHKGAAETFVRGISKGHSKENPGFWLHTSGTGILCWADMDAKVYGEAPTMGYDDFEGVDKLTSLPDTAFHRDVDKVVLEAGIKYSDSVKTAVICPPTIYGPGRGPGSGRSRQVPNLVKYTLKEKKALQLGKGQAEWDHVHVHDLSQLFVLLAEAAVAKKQDPELWGQKGYYLCENGTHVWGQLAKHVAEVARKAGYIPSTEVKVLSADEAKEIAGFEALSWGLNSKGKAKRAHKLLGWTPKGESLDDSIPALVEVEARELGLSKGHAASVTA